MMVDEMADFYYQMMMGMADSFKQGHPPAGNERRHEKKNLPKEFFEKFRALQISENGA